MQPLLEAAHADLELREIVEVQDGSVHSYFHASSQYGNGTHSLVFASTPQGWGKGGHGCCSCGCQTAMGLVISVEGEDPAIGMLL